MEVPEFCRRASQRIANKRKTEEELDPDYQPVTATKSRVAATATSTSTKESASGSIPPATPGSSKNFRSERKKVRRSRTIAEDLRKPTPGLQFIDRNDYSIENWKQRAAEVHKNRILGTANEIADVLKDADTDRLAELEYPVHEIMPHGSKNPYARYVEPGGVSAELEEFDFDYNNLPPYVMGTGKGEPGGPPDWEFKTLWHYELTPIAPDQVMDNSILPWTKKDATVPDLTPDVLSIVASFSVGCVLDLKMIALDSRNIEYNPERFAPLIMRIRTPKSTALIFASGRLIVAGARSEEECRQACRKYARLISKFGYRARVCNFEIQNISASCSLKFRVRLNQLCKNKLFGPLSYEPEMFPGLVIPLEYPKLKIIIFATGSVLMTGGKSEADVQLAFKKIYPLVRMYAP